MCTTQVVVTLLEPIQRRAEPIPGEKEAPVGNAAVAAAAAHVLEYIVRKCSELFKVPPPHRVCTYVQLINNTWLEDLRQSGHLLSPGSRLPLSSGPISGVFSPMIIV